MRLPRRGLLLAGLVLALLSPAGCADPELRIERLHMQDLQAPAMFRDVAVRLHRPFVLELPPRPVNERFDLEMDDVTLGEALRAIARLDPQFQQAQQGEALVLWPSGEQDLTNSPFSAALGEVAVEGGVGDVVRSLLTQAGHLQTTNLVIEMTGLRRPVKLSMKDVTLRDAFVEVARQAQLGFIIEPGRVNVVAVPE